MDFLLWSCVSWLPGWAEPLAPGKAGSSVWHLLPWLSRQALLPWVAPPNGGLGSTARHKWGLAGLDQEYQGLACLELRTRAFSTMNVFEWTN